MPIVKLTLGPALTQLVPRITNALQSGAESLHEIARAFASIAGSLEKLSTPVVEVDSVDEGPHAFQSPFSSGRICVPKISQDPADHSKHDHVDGALDTNMCTCGELAISSQAASYTTPGGQTHRRPPAACDPF